MTDNLPVTNDDGFDNAAGGRLIQGELIRFLDGKWATKEGTPLPPELGLLVVGTARALQRWAARLPVETIAEARTTGRQRWRP